MKMKMLFLALGLLLATPGFASANPSVPDNHGGQEEKAPCDCQEGRHHQMMHRDWQVKMAEREQKLLTLVTQYTPDMKAEWTKVLDEKKALRSQWMSPENVEKREQWKQNKMAQMEDLKKQMDEGKITKEEFIKKAHGGKEMGHWKTFHDLEIAVEAKNNKHAAVLLNQLLAQYKQHNQMLKEMIKK
jgi:hypothetical protein